MVGPSRRLSWGIVLGLATVIGVATIGCSTAEEASEALDDANKGAEDESENDATAKKKKADDDAPAFNPSFADAGTKGVPATQDPAPPEGAGECIDNDDPGGAENVSKKLPDTDDCDDDYKTISGVMKGAVDVDFYKLSATDKGPSLSNPLGCRTETDFETQTAGTELCVFMRCKNSTVDAVTGCEAGVEKTSEIGMKGCCAPGPGRALPTWDCSGLFDNDSADIFLRVRQTGNNDKCLPYKVKYRF